MIDANGTVSTEHIYMFKGIWRPISTEYQMLHSAHDEYKH